VAEPAQALADLTEISSQIRGAVLVDEAGGVMASTFDDGTAAEQFARAARELLDAAADVRQGGEALNQLEAATFEGSVFVVRDDGRLLAATTSPDPTVGLVFYDLKSCLRSLAETSEEPAAESAESPPAKKPRSKGKNKDA
jgi:predicted regulator of Ras-like GTPase activity (Roadblock/LC7/MglB family)